MLFRSFGLPWEPHPVAWERMERAFPPGGFNEARQRMATMPRGAELIDNAISVAPGFTIGNVHVMAGVPEITVIVPPMPTMPDTSAMSGNSRQTSSR